MMNNETREIDTPALLLDMECAERNIARMSECFRGKKAHLRPHVKVHKWLVESSLQSLINHSVINDR